MNNPIFILGANRSGTTLLRLILNAHSRIAIPEEVVYFGSFMAGVPIESWRAPSLSEEQYRSFVQDFVVSQCAHLTGVDQHEIIDLIMNDTPFDFRKPYTHLLTSWAGVHGKQRWGEKTPGNLFYADILLEMFPDAKFIHVVRDPRAGVSSMMNTTFFPKDIVFNALSRHKFMTEGKRILENAVPAKQRMELRYEDLVSNPEEVVRSLAEFIEEEFEPSMLAFYKDSSKYMKSEAASSFNNAATRPISGEMLTKWKKKLTASDIAQIEAVCRNEMIEYGYSFEDAPLTLKARSEIVLKKLYWKWQVQRNKDIRHFTVKTIIFKRFRDRVKRALRLKVSANPERVNT